MALAPCLLQNNQTTNRHGDYLMADSPTTRTLKKMRDQGYLAAVVEKWNPHVKVRNDLFGFIDVLAISDNETVAIQTTSYSNMSKRIKKIQEHENVGAVRKAGWKIVVHGWRKVKNRWQVREVDVS